jgi:ABC-2 type transport system permease protein
VALTLDLHPEPARRAVFQILLFAYIGRQTNTNSDEFYVIGNALQYCAIPCIFAMGTRSRGSEFADARLHPRLAAKRVPLFFGGRCR